jgi:hypothetical protein
MDIPVVGPTTPLLSMETAGRTQNCPRAFARVLATLFTSGAPATSIADARRASGAGARAAEPRRSFSQMLEVSPASTAAPPGKTHAPSVVQSLSASAIETAVRVTSKGVTSLGLGTKLAYSFLRMPLSSLDFTFRPARTAIWVDTLGQSLSTQASLISAVKSLDLLLGFSVGQMPRVHLPRKHASAPSLPLSYSSQLARISARALQRQLALAA